MTRLRRSRDWTHWRAPFRRWLTVTGELAALALSLPLLAFLLVCLGIALRLGPR